MNENDLIYLAGFVDGEGSIGVEKYNRYGTSVNYGIKISITNSQKQILDWVKEDYGGYTTILKRRKANHHICYQLVLRHLKAYKLIKDLEPYLRLKKELAQTAMRIGERCQIKYDHFKSKPLERRIADENDYQLMKYLISSHSFRGLRTTGSK